MDLYGLHANQQSDGPGVKAAFASLIGVDLNYSQHFIRLIYNFFNLANEANSRLIPAVSNSTFTS